MVNQIKENWQSEILCDKNYAILYIEGLSLHKISLIMSAKLFLERDKKRTLFFHGKCNSMSVLRFLQSDSLRINNIKAANSINLFSKKYS